MPNLFNSQHLTVSLDLRKLELPKRRHNNQVQCGASPSTESSHFFTQIRHKHSSSKFPRAASSKRTVFFLLVWRLKHSRLARGCEKEKLSWLLRNCNGGETWTGSGTLLPRMHLARRVLRIRTRLREMQTLVDPKRSRPIPRSSQR